MMKNIKEYLQVLGIVLGFLLAVGAGIYFIACFLSWHIYPLSIVSEGAWFIIRLVALFTFGLTTWIWVEVKNA